MCVFFLIARSVWVGVWVRPAMGWNPVQVYLCLKHPEIVSSPNPHNPTHDKQFVCTQAVSKRNHHLVSGVVGSETDAWRDFSQQAEGSEQKSDPWLIEQDSVEKKKNLICIVSVI